MCATDARIVQFINSAQQRLLNEGKWWGTCAKYTICSTAGCITLPPQFATIESVALCHRPIPVRNFWYEFLENGLGTRGECSCWPEAVYRGRYPVFTDITGVDKKLLWVADVLADVGQKALFLGYDENANWIRTQVNGVWQDGEIITASQSPGTQSVHKFSIITDIQFPAGMSGQSWLYSYSTTDASQIMLGHYQAFEVRPSYARYLFPSLQNQSSGSKPVLVEAMCKLEFIPAINPTDYLLIANIPALEEMCVALNRSENEPDSIKSNSVLTAGMAVAKGLLDKELLHYLGDGAQMGINIQGSSCPGGGPTVENLI